MLPGEWTETPGGMASGARDKDMKNYFRNQFIGIPSRKRRELVVAIANHILARRDRLKPVDIGINGKRGKFTVKVFDERQYFHDKSFDGYFDTCTSDSQVLEYVNDRLPRVLKGRHFWVRAGLDGKRFVLNKSIKFEP